MSGTSVDYDFLFETFRGAAKAKAQALADKNLSYIVLVQDGPKGLIDKSALKSAANSVGSYGQLTRLISKLRPLARPTPRGPAFKLIL